MVACGVVAYRTRDRRSRARNIAMHPLRTAQRDAAPTKPKGGCLRRLEGGTTMKATLALRRWVRHPSSIAILCLGQRHGHALVAIEARDRKRCEVHAIESLVDRQQANPFPDQRLAHKYARSLPVKSPPQLFASYLQSVAAFRFSHPRWIRSRRTRVHRTRSLHSQRFVRPLFVVPPPKTIERSLLRRFRHPAYVPPESLVC